jgi:two-component system sensor histidine kinase/response regulator
MLQPFWTKIIGEPIHFSLEARIFNSICFISAIGLSFGIINNFLIGAQQIVMVMVPVLACVVFSYYNARYNKKLNSSFVLYMVATNVLIIVNFRYNSGINGPAILIFILSYFLTISIVPPKQFWFWIILNLSVVISLLFVNYKYPNLIISSYHNNISRFVDFGFVYFLMAFIILMVTKSIRKSYYSEKELVERKAAELEIANDTKNKLFSILAHDLRSPLTSIQNYLEILSEFRLDNTEKLSIEKELLNSTQYTQQMLSNLLSWSKSQMKGVTVNLTNLNLKEALQGTFKIHQTIAAEKGIYLGNELKNNVSIIADRDMLQLVVRNLINNAIKFTAPGGEINIADDIAGDYCRIIVRDSGTGIPIDKQENIFSLKVNSTYGTKNEKGVGLGLVLCKEFTERQNGKITFESVPGKGTTFYVSFKIYPSFNDINVSDNGKLVNNA